MLTGKRLTYTLLSTATLFFPTLVRAEANTNAYPAQVVQTFMQECTEKSGKKQVCACVLDRIQDEYDLEQFSKLEQKYRATGKIPKEVKKFMFGCVASNFANK
jgi:hypothetical protein